MALGEGDEEITKCLCIADLGRQPMKLHIISPSNWTCQHAFWLWTSWSYSGAWSTIPIVPHLTGLQMRWGIRGICDYLQSHTQICCLREEPLFASPPLKVLCSIYSSFGSPWICSQNLCLKNSNKTLNIWCYPCIMRQVQRCQATQIWFFEDHPAKFNKCLHQSIVSRVNQYQSLMPSKNQLTSRTFWSVDLSAGGP